MPRHVHIATQQQSRAGQREVSPFVAADVGDVLDDVLLSVPRIGKEEWSLSDTEKSE